MGDGVVERLAAYVVKTQPGLRGFTRANLFRMRQFYETTKATKKSYHWCVVASPHHPGPEQTSGRA
jgi:hypothetical protein